VTEVGTDVVLSISRAAWNEVTPSLRGVAASWDATSIRARFWFDTLPSEDDVESVSMAEGDFLADFWATMDVQFTAEHLPDSERRELPGEHWCWVYLRHEPSTSWSNRGQVSPPADDDCQI